MVFRLSRHGVTFGFQMVSPALLISMKAGDMVLPPGSAVPYAVLAVARLPTCVLFAPKRTHLLPLPRLLPLAGMPPPPWASAACCEVCLGASRLRRAGLAAPGEWPACLACAAAPSKARTGLGGPARACSSTMLAQTRHKGRTRARKAIGRRRRRRLPRGAGKVWKVRCGQASPLATPA